MGPAFKHAEAYFERDMAYTAKMPFEEIAKVAEIMFRAYLENRQFFFIGNGGSFATASHAYNDFLKGTGIDGKRALKVISLTDPSVVTAVANDIGFDEVFVYQLRALLKEGDVVTGISASGNSENVIKAIEYANEKNSVTIGWLGFGGGKLRTIVKYPIIVPSQKPEYGPAEDLHLKLDHFFVEYLRKRIAEN